MQNIISFTGIFFILFIAFLFSEHKRRLNYRLILVGLLVMFAFGAVLFLVPAGAKVFLFINDVVVKILDSSTAGSRFLFGRLALPPGGVNEMGEPSLGFFLAFQALPGIIFFSALMAILYHAGVMQFFIRFFALLFTKVMKLSGAESLSAASNIFVGVEASLVVKPHLTQMTRSELNTVLTAGMASVASNVLAAYVFMLQSEFPTIAAHLISASILSIPAAVILSKVIVPETSVPETLGQDIHPHYEKEDSFFTAVINGSDSGVKLIVGIVALLIAVLGLVSLLDMILSGAGSLVSLTISLKKILAYVFYPFTVMMGVPLSDAFAISGVIGERLIVTEFASYADLAVLMKSKSLSDPRSAFIAAYALCGFAHFASMAIFVGGTAALCPSRKIDIARLGMKSLLGATLATLMTGSLAGVFYHDGLMIFVK